MADLDGDGKRDVVSGSWPGPLHWFRGEADRGAAPSFAKSVELRHADGKTINVGSASAPAVVDWDGDGDLDLVVGTVDGKVWFLPNVSAKETGLAFGPAALVSANGKDLRVPMGDAGPCAADWDGDGRVDLLVGAGDGSVRLFRNRAAAGLPDLGPGEVLVEAGSMERGSGAGDQTPRGTRSKVCVADWNADGKADLLLGDFLMEEGEPPVLTAEQIAERDAKKARMEPLQARMTDRYAAHRLLAIKRLGLQVPFSEEDQERVNRAMQEAVSRDPRMSEMGQEMSEIWTSLRAFETPTTPRGHVWVFLRR